MPRLPLFVEPVPLDLAWKDPGANMAAIEREVRRRLKSEPDVDPEARLFLFPELALTGFVTKDPPSFKVEPPDWPLGLLQALAFELRTAIAVGFPEHNPADPGKPLNSLAVLGPDGEVDGLYRKNHLFTLGETPESAAYTVGDRGTLFEYRGWRIALAICFDIRFSALFLKYAKEQADLILVAACWVGGQHKSYQYRTLCSAHAILAQAYVAAVNRAGKDPSYEYDGSAYVFSPYGEDLYKGRACALEPSLLEACRRLAVRVADRKRYSL